MIDAAHAMPFGTELHADGVTFRLWAPDCDAVDVVVDDAAYPMQARADGWFAATVGAARACSRRSGKVSKQTRLGPIIQRHHSPCGRIRTIAQR